MVTMTTRDKGCSGQGEDILNLISGELEIEFREEQKEQKNATDNKPAMTYKNLELFTGEVEFLNARKIKVDKNYSVG